LAPPRILILGVGNVLMGDEGAGVQAIRVLESRPWPPHVTLLDGGTGGFHLLGCLDDCDALILIDAALDGRPEGNVSVIEPRYARDFPSSLSAHDIGLRDLVESAALLGRLPRIRLVTVSIAEPTSMQVGLSPRIEASLSHVAAVVEGLAASLSEQDDGCAR